VPLAAKRPSLRVRDVSRSCAGRRAGQGLEHPGASVSEARRRLAGGPALDAAGVPIAFRGCAGGACAPPACLSRCCIPVSPSRPPDMPAGEALCVALVSSWFLGAARVLSWALVWRWIRRGARKLAPGGTAQPARRAPRSGA